MDKDEEIQVMRHLTLSQMDLIEHLLDSMGLNGVSLNDKSRKLLTICYQQYMDLGMNHLKESKENHVG